MLVGTAAASTPLAELDALNAALALQVALALQIAVNYANDYFDGVKGVDTEARVGPRRAVASGLVTPAGMKQAMINALAVGALTGLVLALRVGPELLLVGVAALLATLGYSGGSKPYASAGLGEVVVFVFFGVVATVGSAYVQDGSLTTLAVVASLPMGGLATALLVVNNLRDIPTDRDVGKRTLAVRLGDARTRGLYLTLVGASYLAVVPLVALTGEAWLALPLLSLPLAWLGVEQVRRSPVAVGADRDAYGPQLIEALSHTARAQLAYAVLLTVALVVVS